MANQMRYCRGRKNNHLASELLHSPGILDCIPDSDKKFLEESGQNASTESFRNPN